MLSARAAVRAHVTALQDDLVSAGRYLAAAEDHLAPAPPRLIAIGGVSGTGKTTLARRMAPQLGAAPGAVVLRSDEIRKRLAGIEPLDRLPRAAYTQTASDAVYDEMFRLAGRVLRTGQAVSLDAVFLRPEERDAAERVAVAAGVPFAGIWLEGRPDQLRARLTARTGDASDAGPAILDEQLGRDPGPIGWERVDAADPEMAAARIIGGAKN